MEKEIKIEGNMDIDQALKEFKLKEQEQQAQQTLAVSKNSDVPKIVQLVMKWSGLKEERQAEYVLFGFVVVVMGISLYLFFGGNIGKKVHPQLTPEMRFFVENGDGL